MGSKPKFSLLAAVLMALAGLSAASSFISDGVFWAHGSGGRSLLQAKTSCPVNFEFMNYTIITSQCKGPQYPAKQCCKSLTDFACPYAAELNDLTNDCASTMFSYINLYGKYPPGLFSSECREGKEGLACPADAPQSSQNYSSAGHANQSLMFLLVVGSVLAFLFS